MPSCEGLLWAAVLAGGAGTRFWPLSRRRRPKQLLPLLGERSLLALTVERLLALVPPQRLWVVTVAEVADAVRQQLPELPAENVLVEPVGRDTAACVGWLSWRAARLDPEALLLVAPSDHVIRDEAAFRRTLQAATQTAARHSGLVTLGVRPTRPETGYGYLEFGELVEEVDGVAVHRVQRFVEKPAAERAAAYLASGRYRWNSGIFAWRVAAMEAAMREHLPALAAGLDRIAADTVRLGEDEALARHYPQLPKISVDFGVMEKARQVWGVSAEFGWSDVGSWTGLEEVLAAEAAGVTIGAVVSLDSARCVLVSDGPLLAAVGVHDLVVVATRDAVLVVPKDQAQRVKQLVERLQRDGKEELL
ncbi:MAG: NTP transferase domain-containing protein [Thermoanaerobaculaceae bacterium]|nr:NTP transferase domain-containing protein [Thermoanaerobaculaceae bacterium]